MATKTSKKPAEHDDPNRIQDDYDQKFNEMTSPNNYSRDGEEPKNKPSDASLHERESRPDGGDSDEADTAEKSRVGPDRNEDSLYDPGEEPKKSIATKAAGLFTGKKKWGWIGGGFGILGIIIMSFFTSSLELVHIKELLNQKVGQSTDTVLSDRTRRVYNRMFFFRDDGKLQQFDGLKQQGLFSFLENKRTTKLLDEMRAQGFEIEPEMTGDGRWTGRLNRIALTQDGTVFINMNQRNAIKDALEKLYPEKSEFWRGARARELYRRYNLTYLRGGWLKDSRLFTGLESFETRLRQTLRDTLFGDARNTNARVGVGDLGEEATDESAAFQEQVGDIGEGVEQRAEDLLVDGDVQVHNVDFDVNTGALVGATAKGAVGGVVRSINILGTADTACEIKRFSALLSAGATVLKSKQLMSYAVMFFSAADAQKSGHISGTVLNGFMNLIRQDTDDGKHGLYDSGAYGWLLGKPGSVVNPINRDHYSVAGGFTGPLAVAYSIADNQLSGRACGFVGNIFVQIGGIIAGIAAGVVTLGGALIVNAAATITLSIAYEFFKALAIPYITEMLLGNIISWDEMGEQYMDALVSGTGAMYAANGANFGMKPLTVTEYAVLRQQAEDLEREKYASVPIWQRLFDYEDTRSLVAQLFLRSPKSINESKNLATDFLSSPVGTIAQSFNGIFDGPYAYAQEVSQCPDEMLAEANMATDPFCNPIYGESLEGLAIEPDDNYIYMFENNHVDEEGEPESGEYQEFVERCVENYTDYFKLDENAGTISFDSYCMEQDEQTLNFRAFSGYKPLVDAIDGYLNGGIGVQGFTLP